MESLITKNTYTINAPIRDKNLSYFQDVTCCMCGKVFQKREKYVRRRLIVREMPRFFCSYSCNNKFRRKLAFDEGSRLTLNCADCGKVFTCNKFLVDKRNRKYCSNKCRLNAQKTKEVGSVRHRRGLMQKLQKTINLYVRQRDCNGSDGAVCISCGEWKQFKMLDAGHFIPTTCSATRFDERNINAQCVKCNRYLSGNQRHYLYGMIKKYGKEIVDELESKEGTTKKWEYVELEEIYLKYKSKLKAGE